MRICIITTSVLIMIAGTASASTPPPTAVIHHFPDRHEVVFFSGEEVLFDGSASHANFVGGSINRWDWYIDGSWQHGGTQNQHNTFSWIFTLGQGETEKTFQVRLRVRDTQNQFGNKYLTVTVKPKPKRYYYLKDHLGSVRAVVDDEGNVVSYDDYYPFGLRMPGRSLAGDTYSREKFSGNELDEETGYIYFGARYYNPELGRFFNVDRFSDKYPSLTPYQYAVNDPILFIDLNGDSVVVHFVRSGGPFDAYHAALFHHDEVTGEIHFLAEGMPQNRLLSKAKVSHGWGNLVAEQATDLSEELLTETVPIPTGMTEEDFVAAITEAFSSYDDAVPYQAIPRPRVLFGLGLNIAVFPHETGNSNSLIGSILRQAGSDFVPSVNVPGWQTDVLPSQRR